MPSSPKSTYKPAPNLLRERTVLVTGAGDGIGKAAATAFASYGANVVLLGRTRSKLEAVSDQIREETETDPLIVPVDLALLAEEGCTQLEESIRSVYERLDGILHNASILGPMVPIQHYSYEQWVQVFQVNVHAQFLLTKTLLPLLAESQDASIILTSSGVGRKGRAYWGAYAASKFATEALMEVLADEVASTSNIRVNSLNPGGTRTAMRASAFPAEDPMSLPTPSDHMPLYLYLMGPDSVGINGQKFDALSWQYTDSRQ